MEINKVFDKLMGKIGFMRISNHENQLALCEEFAKDYLEAYSGATVDESSGLIHNITIDQTAVVIGSRVRISQSVLKNGVVVAPWVKNFEFYNCQFSASPKKKPKALLSLSDSK